MSVFSNSSFDDHERVLFCSDAATGLRAIIAIHSTVLGPAAGGCRQWAYASEEAGIYDVLRLSRGMSYKNAMAGLRFGGGKAVIFKTPDFKPSEALYERFGEFVDSLQGEYVTAEDVGMSVAVMEMIARRTKYVSGLPQRAGHAGGDPSPKTAFGIFKGIEAAVAFKLQKSSLQGLSVAVQGVGNVGYYLCRYLAEAGANLRVADIDEDRVQRAVDEFAAVPVALDEILYQDVDVVAPCALGAILSEQTIPKIRSSIIAGGANNQLETDADGRRLLDAGILYAPDYVINGGGIINVASEFYGGEDDEEVMRRVAAIGPRLSGIFQEAASSGRPTNEIADSQARRIIGEAGTA
ncbi:MAG: Glu/Leu/Phe/Val dehydrogenase [Woeseia sp.]|nr:amino acid dehydrogenase [Woeseia sp.]MBT8096410.1 amino acid dehydrogenase [Woeseia sp.]NNE60877.1 Glu/Leu/Phe/Val dehydrogenase [Woeseia sp.]NNL55955.1 Glu/Leu/Phe/Val dehydrogenase [Woeseia sp.]